MAAVTLDIIQLVALVAVLAGVALTVPIGLALIINGGLVLGAAMAAERWG